MDHPEHLSESEQDRFVLIMSSFVRHYEAIYLDHCEGLLPERVRLSQGGSTKQWMSRTGPQLFISRFSYSLDPEFVRFVSSRNDGGEHD